MVSTYTTDEAEEIRGVLYLIAGLHLNASHTTDEDDAESHHLHPRLYRRAG